MADSQEKRNFLGPYIPQGNLIREVVQQVKLAYNLLLDPRVPTLTKLIPVAALAYLFMPIDVLPDIALGLGQLDDLAVLMLGLRTFFEFAPAGVVHEHLQRLAEAAQWSVAEPPANRPAADGDVVDGSVHTEK